MDPKTSAIQIDVDRRDRHMQNCGVENSKQDRNLLILCAAGAYCAELDAIRESELPQAQEFGFSQPSGGNPINKLAQQVPIKVEPANENVSPTAYWNEDEDFDDSEVNDAIMVSNTGQDVEVPPPLAIQEEVPGDVHGSHANGSGGEGSGQDEAIVPAVIRQFPCQQAGCTFSHDSKAGLLQVCL